MPDFLFLFSVYIHSAITCPFGQPAIVYYTLYCTILNINFPGQIMILNKYHDNFNQASFFSSSRWCIDHRSRVWEYTSVREWFFCQKQMIEKCIAWVFILFVMICPSLILNMWWISFHISNNCSSFFYYLNSVTISCYAVCEQHCRGRRTLTSETINMSLLHQVSTNSHCPECIHKGNNLSVSLALSQALSLPEYFSGPDWMKVVECADASIYSHFISYSPDWW